MNPISFTRAAFLVLLLFAITASAAVKSAASAEASRPGMVIFLSDDHTWRDSSVYGSPDIKTPNMQRLANAGMTFDNAFVASPSCAPSRAALLTGMYPARNGAEPNHSRPHADLKKLPAYLQNLGYEVASFGKVGHYRQTPEYGYRQVLDQVGACPRDEVDQRLIREVREKQDKIGRVGQRWRQIYEEFQKRQKAKQQR